MNAAANPRPEVSELIRDDILSGQFEPGQRLTAAALASRYKTSAMPIREALSILQGQGLVVSTPNQGARVRLVDADYVEEIYELRCALIKLLLPKSIRFITNDDLDKLQRIQRSFEEAIDRKDLRDTMRHNADFHRTIYSLGKNPSALAVMETTWLLLDAMRTRFGFGTGRLNDSKAGHRKLLGALMERNQKSALEIALSYTENAKKDLIACIAAAQDGGSK